ncbi:MAG: NYN domain-containing protein [Candidatus Babeliales bacterium]|jgi:predicted RNA-binding protein with PIN domain
MILIIDGYNVLKQLFPGLKNNLDKQKAAFIRQLAFYKRKKTATIQEIIVVFDAGPFSHASRSIKSDIVIMYSGTKSTADAWILSYVENNRNKEILVITRDREIREACQQMGVDSLGSDEFYRILHDSLIELPSPQATETTIEKYDPIMLDDNESPTHSLSPEALDILMEQSSIEMVSVKPNDNDVRHSRQSPAHNLTKKERRIQAKIKKLS